MFAAILLVAAVSGLVQGLSGFAFGLIATAFWAWMLEPQQVVPLVALGSLLGQAVSMFSVGSQIRLARLGPFVVGGFAGVPLGASVLQAFSAQAFRTSVGVGLIVFCTLMLRAARLPRLAVGRAADGCVGFVAGAMTGACGIGGPPMTLWCAMRQWSMAEQRATFQPFFMLMQTLVVALLAWHGVLDAALLKLFASIAPAIVLCSWLGSRWSRRISEARFKKLILVLLLVAGVTLVLPSLRQGWQVFLH